MLLCRSRTFDLPITNSDAATAEQEETRESQAGRASELVIGKEHSGFSQVSPSRH